MSKQMSRREFVKVLGLGSLVLPSGCSAVGEAVAASASGRSAERAAYSLPELPYAYDALAPEINEGVLRTHHEKHHAGYVKGLNATLEKLSQTRGSGDFSTIKALSRALAFHGSGHVLHSLYWRSMTPGGSAEPKAALRSAIDRDFGSLAALKGQFAAAAKKVEGSGWAVLAHEPMGGRLFVLQAEKHQNLTIWGVVPLMVCDVWEHAYYFQYKNRRADYVDSFFRLVDWGFVAERFRAAVG